MVEENIVTAPDFVPGEGFSIELVDGEQKPIAKARLKASLDGAPAKPVKSDENGIIKVKTEPTTKSITLQSMEEK
jgi:hypothetical protein